MRKRTKITLTFYTDPGHGWLKAPHSLLHEFGIENKVTSYSYVRNNDVFLEEDCDAGLLMDALRQAGVAVTIKRQNTNKSSKIRSYGRYVQPQQVTQAIQVRGY